VAVVARTGAARASPQGGLPGRQPQPAPPRRVCPPGFGPAGRRPGVCATCSGKPGACSLRTAAGSSRSVGRS